MTKRDTRRDEAIERMADHLLVEGLAGATLRPLAVAAGMSDRMLLYYFADKDDLLTATLDHVAARMLAELGSAIPAEPRQPFAALLRQAWTALASERLRPFMPLWLDLAAGSARGLQPHRTIAGHIAEGFLSWVAVRLSPGEDGEASSLAAFFLAVIEGAHLLSAFGRPDLAASALAQTQHLAAAPRYEAEPVAGGAGLLRGN